MAIWVGNDKNGGISHLAPVHKLSLKAWGKARRDTLLIYNIGPYNIIMLTRKLIHLAKFRWIQAEFLLDAVIKHYTHLLGGGSIRSRMEKFKRLNYTGKPPQGSRQSRLAIFVAYHDSSNAPLSNLNYLKSLLDCEFRIIYVHNGKLQEKSLEKIKPFCEKIICRENIGQDFGAWKDTYLYLKDLGYLTEVEWLLLCNDSNYFVGGANADAFTSIFTKALDKSEKNLIALNINLDLEIHFQSFFLCFKKSLFGTEKFEKFWRDYVPLNHRHHAINKGEIKLTRDLLGKAKFSCLYNSNKLLNSSSLGNEKLENIINLIPQNLADELIIISKELGQHSDNDTLRRAILLRVLSFLDHFNTSHVYALLFFRHLESPFLKKDLVKSGSYSYLQIASALKEKGNAIDTHTYEEILQEIILSGNPYSFTKLSARIAYRKGIRKPLDRKVHYLDRLTNKRFWPR